MSKNPGLSVWRGDRHIMLRLGTSGGVNADYQFVVLAPMDGVPGAHLKDVVNRWSALAKDRRYMELFKEFEGVNRVNDLENFCVSLVVPASWRHGREAYRKQFLTDAREALKAAIQEGRAALQTALHNLDEFERSLA